MACFFGTEELVDFFLSSGADPEIPKFAWPHTSTVGKDPKGPSSDKETSVGDGISIFSLAKLVPEVRPDFLRFICFQNLRQFWVAFSMIAKRQG